ncbi:MULTISPECIES: ABC transporter substrate-binding protein [Paenibacillus]|jgi:multiple sugar transport system substrate-binding protein|uniref:ABC transporter substrate-binding protein n=3 Tax=Paenibacillus TaxID=44249 RepID=A0A1R1EEW5_9BACL|nr:MULTISPECIES: sugar ABC transporter substrate-binding protein [Paenibacillus]MEC0175950.1 sugar ABC transporter substrate-binding protein [Paenibacillus favisporus]OMF50383.1 ABC transporter substrate-binding protein [Paenibacillus rhizosphaerae]PQP85733.1 sugar ABC transporter substrate-binding protein [Paenibacillus sp. AR247]RED31692.1 carbohydrate ABC transporter substrate-binding protein (CUT1 family) [Paenibacillus sp. VMFN-D1]UYO07071.1 sugar ABC transporter substrate-binding protein
MARKMSIILVFLFLFTAVMTGCGGSSGEAGGKKVINVALWDENVKDTVNKSIELYKKNHPDVEVKVTYTPWADYWTKLKTSLAGNSGPDVFWMNGPNFYAYASKGWIKDLQPLIDESKLDTSVYTDALVNLYTYNDHLYGLPYFLDAVGLYYNKELFDKAGVSYPDGSWTWDTIEQNAAKLTDKQNGVYGYTALIDSQSGYYDLIHQAGGYIISEDKTKSGFDSPEALSAFQWEKKLMDQGYSPNAQQQLETKPLQLFGSGKAAMFPAISVSAPELYKLLGDKLGVAPLPAGKQKATIVHGLSWAMNEKTKHQQEAWDLIQVLSGKEGEQYLAESGFSIPAYKGTEEGWLKSIPSLDLKVFVDSLDFAVPYPVSERTAEWQDVETKELQDAYLGKKSFEEALKTIADKMNEILAEEKKD